MNRSAISLIVWTVILILALVLVFNHVFLFGFALPLVFIYTLIKLPMSMSKEWQFTIAFLLGLIIDIFSDTPGLNALASTVTIALRRPVIRLYVLRDEELSDQYPGLKTFGGFTFFRYVLTFCLLYCAIVFAVEDLSFAHPERLLLRIVCSTILTSLLILGIDSLNVQKSEKRL